MRIGTTELILILAVALVVFGPSKLPELGRMAGKAIGSFKHYINSYEGDWEEEPAKKKEKSSVEAAGTAQAETEKQEPASDKAIAS